MRASNAVQRKHLILGVDPGTTTGIALLDLDCRLVLLKSARVLSKSDIVSLASSRGKVVMVATDRTQPPRLVVDVARALGAKLFTPELEFSHRDKLKTVTGFISAEGEVPEDEHQTAALFGALKAFKAYKNELEEAERSLEAIGVPDKAALKEQLKAHVIRGLSVSRALKLILPRPEEATPRPKAPSPRSSRPAKKPLRPAPKSKLAPAALRVPYRHVQGHPKTVVVPLAETHSVEVKAEKTVEAPAEIAPAAEIPKGKRRVRFVGVFTRRRIKEMVEAGALSEGEIAYGSRIGDDPEKVARALKGAGISVAVLEELDESSILQMMNEGVVPIPAGYVPIAKQGTETLVEERRVEEARRRVELEHKEILLKLLSERL